MTQQRAGKARVTMLGVWVNKFIDVLFNFAIFCASCLAAAVCYAGRRAWEVRERH